MVPYAKDLNPTCAVFFSQTLREGLNFFNHSTDLICDFDFSIFFLLAKMEDHENKKVKSPSRVFGTIAGKIASTSHLVRDKTEKINLKVHERWGRSNHDATKTVDEEFEDLCDELEAMKNTFDEIIKFNTNYTKICFELVKCSREVASLLQILASPRMITVDTILPGGRADLHDRSKSYSAAMAEIGISLRDTLVYIPKHLDERISKLSSILTKISEKVTNRDKALAAYDKVYDKFDSMTILSTTNEFTSKQKQEYDALEKKIGELKRIYDEHNSRLKEELPIFFELVRSFIEPFAEFLYYVNLTAGYQVIRNLESIEEPGGIDPFSNSTVENFQRNEPQDFLPELAENILSEARFLGLTGTRGKRRKSLSDDEQQDFKRPNTARSDRDVDCGYCRAISSYCTLVDSELEFQKGDMITLLNCEGEVWTGILLGQKGKFPSRCVEKM